MQSLLTLIQRCQLFHRQNSEISISRSTLARLYKKYKVTHKKVRRVKLKIDLDEEPHKSALSDKPQNPL